MEGKCFDMKIKQMGNIEGLQSMQIEQTKTDTKTESKTESKTQKTDTKDSLQQQIQDRVELSRNALAQIEERYQKLQEGLQQANQGSPELKLLDETMKTMKRCQQIASRVRKGDKVPMKDLMYLMKHDRLGYQMAMLQRKQKKNPKKWDSVLKEEEQQKQNQMQAQMLAAAQKQSQKSIAGSAASAASNASDVGTSAAMESAGSTGGGGTGGNFSSSGSSGTQGGFSAQA